MEEREDKPILLYGLFDAQVKLTSLIDQVRREGVHDDAIEVISPVPLSDMMVVKPVTIPLYAFTIIAGLFGIGVGIFFAGGTAALYPIRTGGKAIVAPPVVGIISYETMMLLAIITTFVAMVVKIVFLYRSGAQHDPAIDEGAIGISVRLFPHDVRRSVLRDILRQAGAKEIHER
jgi:hypothetical protein